MTATLPAPSGPADVVDREYASWGRRVVAALMDSAVLGAVAWFAAGDGIAAPTLQPTVGLGAPDPAPEPWTSSAVVVGAWLALLVVQGLTGQTPGRRVMGIAVVRTADGQGPADGPPGVLRSVARWCAHLLDAILLIGYLRPLWHRERRTFADSLLATAVVRRPPVRATATAAGRRAVAATAVAWVLVLVGVAAGVSVGGAAGVERDAEATCVLGAQDPAAAVQVEHVVLARDTSWSSTLRLWPGADRRRELRSSLSLDVSWRVPGPVEPGGSLTVRTTTDGGGTTDSTVPALDGWATVPVHAASDSAVEVAVLLDEVPLTSCTASVGPPA